MWHRYFCTAKKNQIKLGEEFESVSIIDTKFIGRIVEQTRIGDIEGITPTIAGQAWITGTMQYSVDPSDPFQAGHGDISDLWF